MSKMDVVAKYSTGHAGNRILNTMLSMLCLFILSSANAFAGNGYFLPDYFRILIKGKVGTINLGIAKNGELLLKWNSTEFPLYDIRAFRRGIDLAMDNTQQLQDRGLNKTKSIKSATTQSLLLYSSAWGPEKKESTYLTLRFDPNSTSPQYPIKIIVTNHRV